MYEWPCCPLKGLANLIPNNRYTVAGFPDPKSAKGKRGEKARDPAPGSKVNRDDMIKALRQCDGNISQAAERVGCTRLTIQRAVDSDPLVKQARDDARDSWCDKLESTVEYDAINNPKCETLRIFLLKTRLRHRGYEQDDNKNHAQDIAKAAFDFVLNKTANPAES